MACLGRGLGEPRRRSATCDIYLKAFILRNGFHANGDQTKSGLSNFTYRPFTLEGNFAAAQAVHEMLLQSWSPTPGTATPRSSASSPPCRGVDASVVRRPAGRRRPPRVGAPRERRDHVAAGSGRTDGVVRIRDTFGRRPVKWTLVGQASSLSVTKTGNTYEVTLKKGETVEGRM